MAPACRCVQVGFCAWTWTDQDRLWACWRLWWSGAGTAPFATCGAACSQKVPAHGKMHTPWASPRTCPGLGQAAVPCACVIKFSDSVDLSPLKISRNIDRPVPPQGTQGIQPRTVSPLLHIYLLSLARSEASDSKENVGTSNSTLASSTSSASRWTPATVPPAPAPIQPAPTSAIPVAR